MNSLIFRVSSKLPFSVEDILLPSIASVWALAGGLTVGWHRHAAIAAKDRLVEDMAAFLRTEPFWRGA